MAEIIWLKHASVLLKGEKVVFIDPWQINHPEPADLVLVTHDHYDHLSMPDVEALATDNTEILLPEKFLPKLEGIKGKHVGVVPGQKLVAAGLEIEVLPAYNVGKAFHPKQNGHVGYVVTIDGERIYHAGDTDFIPEMTGLAPDVALLPVGGTYTMNASEAAKAAFEMQARRVIPIHFGEIVGNRDDAIALQKASKVPVDILTPRER